MNSLMPLTRELFRWVLQTTWQGAVLAGLIVIAQWLLRKRLSPSWRYGLWLLLIARLLMPGAPRSAFSIFNLARAKPMILLAANPSSAESPNIFNEPSGVFPPPGAIGTKPAGALVLVPAPVMPRSPIKINWFILAQFGWAAGVCFFGARLVWTNARFRSRIGGYRPVGDENVGRVLDECRATLNVTQRVRLIECEEVESPAVYGMWQKWLLLPEGILERFSRDELRCIFLHELAHIKRGDLGVNWLVSVLRVVHWFNPVLWLAFARMRADRELATDALALSHVGQTENTAYGETILKIVENISPCAFQPGLVGIAESKAGLKERLRAISRFGPAKSWRWAAFAVGLVVGGIGLTDAKQITASRPPKKVNDANISSSAESNPIKEISGRIVDAEGLPVSGAQVEMLKLTPGQAISPCLEGTPRLFNPQFPHQMGEQRHDDIPWNYCTTDSLGHFDLNDLADSVFLLAANERGFAHIPPSAFSTNMTVKLEPWCRVEGTVLNYDKVAANKSVSVAFGNDRMPWTRDVRFSTATDQHGHFAFDYCPSGRFSVFTSGISEKGAVKSGETTVVKIGGKGRPVIGRLKFPDPHVQIEWDNRDDWYLFIPEPPRSSQAFKSVEKYQAWLRQPESQDWFNSNRINLYSVQCSKDGSFRIDQVEPGNYSLAVGVHDPTEKYSRKVIGEYSGFDRTFEIPPDTHNTREPVDLGIVEISLMTNSPDVAQTYRHLSETLVTLRSKKLELMRQTTNSPHDSPIDKVIEEGEIQLKRLVDEHPWLASTGEPVNLGGIENPPKISSPPKATVEEYRKESTMLANLRSKEAGMLSWTTTNNPELRSIEQQIVGTEADRKLLLDAYPELANPGGSLDLGGIDILEAVEVTISRDGTVYIGKAEVTLARLQRELKEAADANHKITLTIRADTDSAVGQLVKVREAAQAAGISAIKINVQSAKSEGP